MRFLLETARNSSRKATVNGSAAFANNGAVRTRGQQLWGQQCSPSCGCVLRFESEVDNDGTITSARYHSKTVVTTSVGGKLAPQMTLNKRNPQPLMKECNCSSLHKMASQVTSYLKEKKVSKVQNQLEFTGTRSSLAFQHAVLSNLDLPRKHVHCFDLVEDALTAMMRGYMPGHRRTPTTFEKHLEKHYRPKVEEEEEFDEDFVDRYGRALRRIRKARFASSGSLGFSTPRSISALRMFDLNLDEEDFELSLVERDEPPLPKSMDWVTYVDEMQREEEEELA